MVIYDPNGTPTPLGRKLGGGGEAEIFEIDGQPQLAAKIYRNPTRYREAKLRAMIANPPHDPTLHLGHPSICWPKSLLFNEAGTCAGFSMHRVDLSTHVGAFKLYNPQDRQRVSLSITWKYLVRAATNIAAAVEAIHAQGHVIGDFNESNILVANSALVTLVDCDSMQIRDPVQGICYRCTVGKPDFTPPELQGCEFAKVDRCVAHDCFGLGIMTFLLLMEGVHPFNGVWKGKGNPPILEERIRGGISPYAAHPDVTTMPAAPPLELLPQNISAMFVRCFGDGHRDPSLRPVPAEWKVALSELEENLAECSMSARHVYGKHLAACPWCERKVMLGGVDPFPAAAQQTVRQPPPQAAPAASQPVPGIPDLAIKGSRLRSILRSALFRRAAAALVILALGAVIWSLVRSPVRRLWSSVDNTVTALLKRHPKLSPPLVCTGVDSNGVPVGAAESYTQEQIRETGLMVFMTYTGAVPQQSTFQMRLILNGKVYESKVNTFDHEADFLHVKLGNDLPPGTHRIEFLVDGALQQTANLVIEGDSAQTAAAAPRTTRQGRRVAAPKPKTPPPAAEASPPPVAAPTPPAPEPVTTVRKEPQPAQPRPASLTYKAMHWHGVGSCTGELKLTPQGIEFTSDRHTFRFGIGEVNLDNDGIQDPSGKSWHFAIEDVKVEDLLARWKRGELFPGTAAGGATRSAAAPSGKSVSAALVRNYSARHKHVLGGCNGELELTPETIEFASAQHFFKYRIEDVQIDGDGIRDQDGKSWHFDITGENAAGLLRSWKRGELFGK